MKRGVRTERFLALAAERAAPLLGPLLRRIAERERLSWPDLARRLGGSVDGLNQVALCGLPRPERFAADVEAIAADHVSSQRLTALFHRIQIREAFDRWRLEDRRSVGASESPVFACMSAVPRIPFGSRDIEDPAVTRLLDRYRSLQLASREGAGDEQGLLVRLRAELDALGG